MAITKKHVYSFLFLAIFSVFQFVMISAAPQPALADEALFEGQAGMSDIAKVYGNDKSDLRTIAVKIIVVVLSLLGVIFLALTIFAGFRYMTAAGNEDQTKKAVAQIRDAVIGLVIVMSAWTISYYILRYLNKAIISGPAL